MLLGGKQRADDSRINLARLASVAGRRVRSVLALHIRSRPTRTSALCRTGAGCDRPRRCDCRTLHARTLVLGHPASKSSCNNRHLFANPQSHLRFRRSLVDRDRDHAVEAISLAAFPGRYSDTDLARTAGSARAGRQVRRTVSGVSSTNVVLRLNSEASSTGLP